MGRGSVCERTVVGACMGWHGQREVISHPPPQEDALAECNQSRDITSGLLDKVSQYFAWALSMRIGGNIKLQAREFMAFKGQTSLAILRVQGP